MRQLISSIINLLRKTLKKTKIDIFIILQSFAMFVSLNVREETKEKRKMIDIGAVRVLSVSESVFLYYFPLSQEP